MSKPQAPCPSTIPAYYTLILHAIGTISIPTNVLSLYLVWTHAPDKSRYKFCLAYLQVVTLVTEMYMSFICPGYNFFPLIGCYQTNEFFGQFIPVHISLTIWFTVFCFELPSILGCFVYRHNSILELNRSTTINRRTKEKKVAVFLSHLFPLATGLSMYKSELSFEQKYIYLRNNYPQCLYYLSFPSLAAYDHHQNPWIAVTGIGALVFVLIFAAYGFFLGFESILTLQKLKQSMSAQTFKMHRTALISLSMQIIIPATFLLIPLYVCFLVVAYELTEWQEASSNTMFLIGSHSLCSSLVMIFTNPKYRNWIEAKISFTALPKQSSTARIGQIKTGTIAPTTVPN